MKHSISMIFVSLAYVFGGLCPAAAGQHLRSILIVITALQLTTSHGSSKKPLGLSNEKQVPVYDDRSVSNTLGSRIVLLSTCLSELKMTKADLVGYPYQIGNRQERVARDERQFSAVGQ